jgi:uncharacterized protein YceH (UPF0502 family)
MELNEFEVRVLAALVEKQLVTPDYYPMTLHGLIQASNQKSQRDPVVVYDESTVQRALDSLREKKLVYTFHGSEARTIKYGHVFPKSYDLDPQETAILCVLMLRGAQTPGELRSRTAHLHTFESLPQLETVLLSLTSRSEPLVAKLPRLPNARESRYAHCLSGPVEAAPYLEASAPKSRGSEEPPLALRCTRLEEEVAQLREEVARLATLLADFRRQFE